MTDASYSTSNAGRHAEGEQDRDNVALALDLRVQLLEALVGLDTPQGRRILLEDGHKDGRHRGTAAAAAAATLPSSPARGSVARRAHHVLERVYEAIEAPGYDGIRRFLERYEANAPLLVPQLPLSHPPAESDLTPHAKAALILEAEHDIRTLERELREIELLDKRGVAGAGNLADCEALRSPLQSTKKDISDLVGTYSTLETRVERLLANYDAYVDTVSQLFISWNDALTHAEQTVTKLEKSRE